MMRVKPSPPPIGIFWLFVLPFALLTAVFGVWPIVQKERMFDAPIYSDKQAPKYF